MIYTKRTYIHLYTFGAQKLHQVTHPQIPSAHRSHPASSQGCKPDSGAAGAQIYESVGIYLPVFGMENSVWLKVETMRKSLHTQGINQAVERGHLWWDVAICWARVTTPLEWHVILKNRWFRGLCNGVPRQICCEFPSIQPCKFWVSRFLCDFFGL